MLLRKMRRVKCVVLVLILYCLERAAYGCDAAQSGRCYNCSLERIEMDISMEVRRVGWCFTDVRCDDSGTMKATMVDQSEVLGGWGSVKAERVLKLQCEEAKNNFRGGWGRWEVP